MPQKPPNPFAWILFVLGVISLLFSLLAQSRMWQLEFGLRSASAGDGAYPIALFVGGPFLLLALGLLGTSMAWKVLRSSWAMTGLLIAAIAAVGGLALFVRHAI